MAGWLAHVCVERDGGCGTNRGQCNADSRADLRRCACLTRALVPQASNPTVHCVFDFAMSVANLNVYSNPPASATPKAMLSPIALSKAPAASSSPAAGTSNAPAASASPAGGGGGAVVLAAALAYRHRLPPQRQHPPWRQHLRQRPLATVARAPAR